MPLKLTKANQEAMMEAAANLTNAPGWQRDAIAFGVIGEDADEISCIAVFQGFAGGESEVHFASIGRPMQVAEVDAFTKLAFHPKMLGLDTIRANVLNSNVAGLTACLQAGFEFQYRKRTSAMGAHDAIVLSMTSTP